MLNPPEIRSYGAPNPHGIYHIRVPSFATLTIRRSRLVATLLVTLDTGARITTSNAYTWTPPQPTLPSLIVRTSGSNNINLNGFSSLLSEASTSCNFNPPGTPYPWPSGTSDVDIADSYPTGLDGLVHVTGMSAIATLGSGFTTHGAFIIEGSVNIGSNSVLTQLTPR